MPSIVIRKVPRPRNTRKSLALVKPSAVVERRELLRCARSCAGSASTAMNGRIEATPAVSKSATSSMMTREDVEAAPLARRQQVHQHPECPIIAQTDLCLAVRGAAAPRAYRRKSCLAGARWKRIAVPRGAAASESGGARRLRPPARRRRLERGVGEVDPGAGAEVEHDEDADRGPDVHGAEHQDQSRPREEVALAVAGRLFGQPAARHDPHRVQRDARST